MRLNVKSRHIKAHKPYFKQTKKPLFSYSYTDEKYYGVIIDSEINGYKGTKKIIIGFALEGRQMHVICVTLGMGQNTYFRGYLEGEYPTITCDNSPAMANGCK